MKISNYTFGFILFIKLNSFAQEYQNKWQNEIDAFENLNGDTPQ